VRDITERKQAEQAIVQANFELESRVQVRTRNLEESLMREKAARTQSERLVHHLVRGEGIASALSGALTLQQIGEVFTSQTLAMVDAKAGLLARQPTQGDKFELLHAVGFTPEQVDAILSVNSPVLLAETIHTKAPVWIDANEAR